MLLSSMPEYIQPELPPQPVETPKETPELFTGFVGGSFLFNKDLDDDSEKWDFSPDELH